MQKTDNSIKEICIASIIRKTIPPISFPYTRLCEGIENGFFEKAIGERLEMLDNELLIVVTFIDILNWTVLTTRKIVACIDGKLKMTNAANVKKYEWGDFKGYNKIEINIGNLILDNGDEFPFHIETGKASMIIIYGIKSLIGQVRKNKADY